MTTYWDGYYPVTPLAGTTTHFVVEVAVEHHPGRKPNSLNVIETMNRRLAGCLVTSGGHRVNPEVTILSVSQKEDHGR